MEDGFSDEFKEIFEKFSFKETVASEVEISFSFGSLDHQCLEFNRTVFVCFTRTMLIRMNLRRIKM